MPPTSLGVMDFVVELEFISLLRSTASNPKLKGIARIQFEPKGSFLKPGCAMVPELFVLSIGNPPVALSNVTVASTLYEDQSLLFPD